MPPKSPEGKIAPLLIATSLLLAACNQTSPTPKIEDSEGAGIGEQDIIPFEQLDIADQVETKIREQNENAVILLEQYSFGINIDESQLKTVIGSDGVPYNHVLDEGGIIGKYPLMGGNYDMIMSYSNELFDSQYLTFITQSGGEIPQAGDHLGHGYIITFPNDRELTLYANGYPGSPQINLSVKEGESFFAVPVATGQDIGSTVVEWVTDDNGDLKLDSNGNPMSTSRIPLTIQQNAITQANFGGIGLAIMRIGVLDEVNKTVTLEMIGVSMTPTSQGLYELPDERFPYTQLQKESDVLSRQTLQNSNEQ